jgi:hypothetical protein
LKIIGLAAHKTPELSILQFGVGSDGLIDAIINVFGGVQSMTPTFSNYAVVDPDSKAIENWDNMFQPMKPEVSFKLLDLSLELEEQGLQLESFDIILVVGDFDPDMKMNDLLSESPKFLRAGGKTIIIERTTNSSSL